MTENRSQQKSNLKNQQLTFSHISKGYPGVKALNDVSFSISAGKVSALMGENGAGKSTLLKILSGDIRPDEGNMLVEGKKVDYFETPAEAIRAGISVIYQERQLMSSLNVMENIFLDDLHENKWGFVNRSVLREKTKALIDEFEMPFHPEDIVGHLSVAHQQMVEIMKAYRRDSHIIAFDEPTAPLTDKETTVLFKLIHKLREHGKIIIYVSHRMAEIFQISDEIVVLKDGCLVTSFKTKETSEAELVKAMVGRDIGNTFSNLKRNENLGEVLLKVEHLETDAVHDINFELRQGEVLGFSGLVGAGRTEVARAIFGADKIKSGKIIFDGKEVNFKSPRDAIDSGIALCPEDRKEQGLLLIQSIRENISLPVLSKVLNGMFLDQKKENELADHAVERYSIKTPSITKKAGELSGGNQQKIILGRWTSSKMETKLLILDEPTKGIDVGSKSEIYNIIMEFARQGISVIFISSELPEVLNISDRIIVMHNGRITGELMREEATEEKVLTLSMIETEGKQ